MNEKRARALVAAERARIEVGLHDLGEDVLDAGSLQRQQTGESADAGSDLQAAAVDMALLQDLRAKLEAVGRAEERLANGTYGKSIDSGNTIPDARLAVAPLAERTIEEQRALEERGV